MRHRLHALCPYFAMFPESFPERWIGELTRRGDYVLDPFSGRGTTALSALLMERRAVATDVNDVAFCLTKAKTAPPTVSALRRRISQLESGFDARKWRHQADQHPEFFHVAYDRRTLQQILYLRQQLRWSKSNVDAMVASLVLGSLHGESNTSKSYLSNQMPRTISTKPNYSVRFWKERGFKAPERDVFELLQNRVMFRYESPPPEGEAHVFHTDMRDLPRFSERLPTPLRCVITSPPYFDVTSFEEDQWLRLWFLGRPPRPTHGLVSRDDRHSFQDKYWGFIADMWRSLGQVLSRRAHVVIRIGSKRWPYDRLEGTLRATSHFAGRSVELLHVEMSEIKNRQTNAFRPGSQGCLVEVDCHYRFRN